MFTDCKLSLINDHLVIQGNQNILVDTGSPMSFHPSGVLVLKDNRINVHNNIPGVSAQYLSEKVGYEIHGLLGMDVINAYPTLICLKDGFFFLDDDAVYTSHFRMYPLSDLAQGLIAITVSVNGKSANMIVDTGAKISYIHPRFTAGMEPNETLDDFSPYIGDFQTDTFLCEVDSMVDGSPFRTYVQRFGNPPQIISMTLQLMGVDGIIGIDLFKRFRLQIRNLVLFLPPQGI